MTQAAGVIEKIYKNPQGYYKFVIGGEWYDTGGKSKPNFQEGTNVEFDYSSKEVNGRYFHTVKGPVRTTSGVASPASSGSGGAKNGQGGAAGGKDKYWENREARDVTVQKIIQYQAARNAAIEVVKLAVDKGLLPDLAKAKPAAQFDLLMSIIDDVTNTYVNQATAAGSDDNHDGEAPAEASEEDIEND